MMLDTLSEQQCIGVSMTIPDVAICCVCSRKYLPQAMTMIWSLQRLSDRYSYHVFLSDLTAGNGRGLIDRYPEVEFYFIDQYADAQILDNALMLSDLEFNTSLKAVALSTILERYRRKTFYCDSDLYFLSEPLAALTGLEKANVVLTPHQIASVSDESDFQMSRTGVFNSGFIGMAGDIGIQAAGWLVHKTRYYCLLEPEESIFVDQKWLDLVPALFGGVCVLREPGYNLAYWNIESRGLDEHTVFLHLSGFDLNSQLKHGEFLSKFSKIRLGDRMVDLLRIYLDAYRRAVAEITVATASSGVSLIENNYECKKPTMARRYSVMSRSFRVKDGDIQEYVRTDVQPFRYARLFRTEPSILKITRIIGSYLFHLGLAGMLDNLVALFRILGRRNSWIR